MGITFTNSIAPIAVINESTVIKDLEYQTMLMALQMQVSRDFAPVWKIDARLSDFTTRKSLPPDHWWLVILDDAAQAGYLGYHELTSYGLPLGFVFANTAKIYGYSWTVTASHELLEMLVDPYINATVFNQKDDVSGTLYAYEVCDPVEDDAQGYKIGDVQVSNFVYPAWFNVEPPHGAKFDHLGITKQSFEIAPNGYMPIFEVSSSTTGWTQIWGKSRTTAPITSAERTRMRRKDISQYKVSTV